MSFPMGSVLCMLAVVAALFCVTSSYPSHGQDLVGLKPTCLHTACYMVCRSASNVLFNPPCGFIGFIFCLMDKSTPII